MKINHYLKLRFRVAGESESSSPVSDDPDPDRTMIMLYVIFTVSGVRPSRRQEHDFVMFVMSEH